MERRPTPGEVRYPSVTVVGHHPISISRIGMKIASYSWYPDIAVTAVPHPSAVRPQFVVKNLNIYSVPVIVIVITIIIIIIVIIVITVIPIPVITVLRISPALKSHARGKQCDYKDNQDSVY